jgi:2-phospho-L-lactate guanylyltransferase
LKTRTSDHLAVVLNEKRLVLRSTYAIVPVRKSCNAKTRLAGALDEEQRSKLTLTMLRDVLDALHGTRGIEKILLVTRDVQAARLGRTKGAHVLWEGRPHGLNPAVRKGIRFAERERARQVLIVPSDVPLAKPVDFRRILEAVRRDGVSVVPSHDMRGTNALLLRPPGIMPVSYGINSFKRHCRLARNRKLHVRILRPRSLRLDIDSPRDLTRVRLARGNTRSQKFLRTLFR